jgi:hypothetical protein
MGSDLALSHEKLFGEIMSKFEEIAIPFVGWVKIQDEEDEVTMLRDQIRIQQNEIHRLMALLKQHGVEND